MRLKRSQRHLSLGQNLQETHPKALVVKSFNSLSAYALRQGIFQSGNQVKTNIPVNERCLERFIEINSCEIYIAETHV